MDFLTNKKATTKDSSVSKYLEIDNESSTTKTFSINLSPVMKKLRNEVPLIHPISSFSPSYLKVTPVMMNNTSTMEEKMIEMEQKEVKTLLNMNIPLQWPCYLSNNCKT